MARHVRKHIKDEKRILKLMYRKGILDNMNIDFKMIGWEYLKPSKRTRRRNGAKYSFTQYLPELHVFSCDYWGEWDSRSLIDFYKEITLYEGAEYCEVEGWSYKNTFAFSREGIINHLQSLTTVRNDSKFNKFLKIDNSNR